MSKKANPASIGLFVIIGLALGIGGLILFSSSRLFRPHPRYIMYFGTSLKGLSPGAPVKYRGVKVGSVAEVLIRHNQAEEDIYMPVIVEMNEKLAQYKSDQTLKISRPGGLEQLIQRGMRAKLDSESLVTGVLYVEVEILTNAPPPKFHQLTPQYPEIPTVPTPVEQLLANLTQLDLRGIMVKLDKLLLRLDTGLGQLDVAEINSGLTNLLRSANRLAGSPDLTNSLQALRRTLDNAETLVKKLNARVDPLADNASSTLTTVQKALTDLGPGIKSLESVLESDGPIRTDLTITLEQLSNAARAVSALAEFLERNPNAVLTGRKPKKDSP